MGNKERLPKLSKKTPTEIMHDELYNIAQHICQDYCKYGDQYRADQEKYDGENPTRKKHCMKCPVFQWYC